MSESHIYTFDIEVYDPKIDDNWRQGKFLVHGIDDVLWTNDIDAAVAFIKESCLKALDKTYTIKGGKNGN